MTDDDFETISNSGYFSNDYMKSIAGRQTEFDSVCFLDLKSNLEETQKKIQTLFSDESYGRIIRVKGFVCDKEGGYQLNATRHEILTDLISIGQGVFIVIGTALNRDKIRELMYSRGDT